MIWKDQDFLQYPEEQRYGCDQLCSCMFHLHKIGVQTVQVI